MIGAAKKHVLSAGVLQTGDVQSGRHGHLKMVWSNFTGKSKSYVYIKYAVGNTFMTDCLQLSADLFGNLEISCSDGSLFFILWVLIHK